jgi:hypothetical protein
MLIAAGESEEQVTSVVDTIRRQRVTSIFHLPERTYGPEESMVRLDDVHVHPSVDFLRRNRKRIFRLDQFSFYLLLLKLSIHFCRSYEGVSRFAAETT